jgi:hypothetical protein
MLPVIARHIDGMLQSDQEQYETLLEAKPKPHVLDDYTVNRVTQVFTTAKNDLPLFDEQLKRWSTLTTLSTVQQQEIARLKSQMAKLHEVVDNVLSLADELEKGTIEKQMAKSDAQLGLEFLLRGTQQGE